MVRKLSAAGPRELPSPRIDEADESNFIDIEQLRQGITMRLPAFSGRPGTQVNLSLSTGNHTFGGEVVIVDPEADISIPVAAQDAVAFAGVQRILLQGVYHGNPIELSPHVYFSAGAEAYAPTIDEAVGDVIPGSATSATLRIKPFEKMAAGDRVHLYLLGSGQGAKLSLEIEPNDIGKDVTVVANTSAHRGGRLHVIYEVDQPGRTLTSLASTFHVEGRMGRVRPVYEMEGEKLFAAVLALTYEGTERCMPVVVTIPDDARASDLLTLFMIPRDHGVGILVKRPVGSEPEREIRLCLPYDAASKFLGQIVYIGCLLEYLSGNGVTVSAPTTSYMLVE